MDKKISVILATYKEKDCIEDLIHEIDSIVNPYEIIVVDDDSPDGTWKIVEEISKKNKKVKLIRRINKRGLASAIKDGVSASKGDILIWMDADFSQPPALMPKLIKALERYDIAIASRWVKGGGMKYEKVRVITSKLTCWFARIILDFSLKDYTSGYIAIKRDVLEDLKIREIGGGYGEYFIDLMYRGKKKGYKIVEIPYVYVPRKFGETKTNPNIFSLLKHGSNYLRAILKIKLDGMLNEDHR